MKTKRRTAKYPAQHTKTQKNHNQKIRQKHRKSTTVLHRFGVYISRQQISICGRNSLTQETQKKPKTETKNQKNVCLLPPPSKVTNRHYSFGLTKISTLPNRWYQVSGTRYHNHFGKRTGMKISQAVPLFRGTPAVQKKLSVVYFCN